MNKKLLALTLVAVMSLSLTGCSTAWVSTLDTILAVAAPALTNILQIYAVAENKPFNGTLSAKVNADAAAIKSLAGDLASASAAAGPGVCSQLEAAITTYGNDQASILAIAQVTDKATQTKIALLSGLVTGTVTAILAVIPNCKASATLKAAIVYTPPLKVKTFVADYNAILVAKTGNAAVDAKTKSLKLPEHGKLVHVLSLGLAK